MADHVVLVIVAEVQSQTRVVLSWWMAGVSVSDSY